MPYILKNICTFTFSKQACYFWFNQFVGLQTSNQFKAKQEQIKESLVRVLITRGRRIKKR